MGRTILAVVGGFIAMFVCVMFITAIATFAFGLDPMSKQPPPFAYIITNLLLSIPCAIVGGYATGLIAKKDEIKHAKYLAIVGIIFGIISLIMPGEGQPLWYRIAVLVVMPPSVIFGGMLRAKQAVAEKDH